MSLITAKYFHDCTETPLQFNSESGWKGVSAGLRLVTVGYVFLVGGAILGGLLLRLGWDDGPLVRMTSYSIREDRDLFLLMGLLALGATALFSYVLVLAGQWRCLMYAPQRQHSKELMYICVNLVLLGLILNGAGIYLDAGSYLALREGFDSMTKLDLGRPGLLLQLGSLVVGLVGSLVFSQFLRGVAHCFQDQACVRSVDLNLGFVGLLLGGSAGVVFCVSRLSLRSEILPWLIGGWLLCFIWHLYLVYSAYRCVEDGLLRGVEVEGKWIRQHQSRAVGVRTLSGLHRLAKRAETAGDE